MIGGRLVENIGLREEIIQKACKLSMKAPEKSPGKPYIHEKSRGSTEVFFAFPGSWSVNDWYSRNPFGEIKVDVSRLPSMKSVGYEEIGLVNEAFSRRFEELLSRSSLASEVEKAMSDRKQIVFTGHSSGGPMAILAAIWSFEKYIRFNQYQISPFCLTFGSPLAGNHIFSHALRREDWARYFIHFVMRHDIVPRIMLSPLSHIEQELQQILEFISPKSPFYLHNSTIASNFLLSVMRNALSVASHTACYLKICTSLLLETVASIVELSPYRPFGIFIFCTGNGKLVVLDDPDAVLQLLFFCLQFSPEEENSEFLQGVFKKHLIYESELQESLNMQDVTYLVNLADVPLSADATTIYAAALNDLGLTPRARLCLRAAGELEKLKLENQNNIDSKKDTIKEALKKIQEYKTSCEIRKVGYYDAFKIQKEITDFNANVKRLELAGIWDEIIEMIKRYELPDGFERRKEWIELGTLFRGLLEPLDIANYYRHLKNEDTGPYMVKARPKRYRFTQKWREHAERMPIGLSSETTFWAEVEELRVKPYDRVKDKVLRLEQQVLTWVVGGWLGKDVFLDESTFTKWWKTLPFEHRSGSCVAGWSQIYDHGTSHLCVIDNRRNIVTMTISLNSYFGSKFVSPSTGIFLNNQMYDFAIPTSSTPPPSPVNFIRPYKRPLSSMAPSIFIKGGQVRVAVGAAGGLLIPNAITQVLINYLNLKIDPFNSVRAPRFYHMLYPNVLYYENYTSQNGDHYRFPSQILDELRKKGHVLQGVSHRTVCQFVIQKLTGPNSGKLVAISDPRKGGCPAGY